MEIRKGKYRHFKGKEYEVIDIVRHSETGEEMVLYKALYGDGGLWVRPACMWNETVERDGKVFRRFEFIG
ncbi:MAG: DUF1653 domain-containing protein [Ruminococcaceae bacterium]|nr:DUF1653 domain-containing protein [Oscillospiraceae bacterium]